VPDPYHSPSLARNCHLWFVIGQFGRATSQHPIPLLHSNSPLRVTDMQVKAVASAGGFSGPAHFSVVCGR
jgi:hypothetical protein